MRVEAANLSQSAITRLARTFLPGYVNDLKITVEIADIKIPDLE